MIQPLIEIFLSLLLLFLAGQLVIRFAIQFSVLMRLSPFVIGAVIMGFATSLPELSVAIKSARAGAPELTIGNIVGSNIANTLLILGLSSLLTPLPPSSLDKKSALFNLLAHILLLGSLAFSQISFAQGIVLLIVFASYFKVIGAASSPSDTSKIADSGNKMLPLVALIASLGLLIFSANTLVQSSISLARTLQVSEKIIGVTLLAVGTSLPEIVMALTAAAYRKPELIYSNVLGSNIFNSLLILGITASLCPISTPKNLFLDGILALLCSIFLICVGFFKLRSGRKVGAFLLSIYAGYIILTII